jgi:Tol biopolymer transport system component/DNA-binding winged helix-turn-helix (wHTH) protein
VPSETSSIYQFGAFQFDSRTGELRKNGVKLKLQDQPYRVLVKLLERPGEIISREQLRSTLWQEDTFVDFENGLNTAIKRLRESLGDSADKPAFIETIPRRGYRFIASLHPPAQDEAKLPEPRSLRTPRPSRRLARRLLIPAGLLLVVLGLLAWYFRPPRLPVVSNVFQITNDAKPKSPTNPFVTDGANLYFIEGMPWTSGSVIAQVSASGGETTSIATSLREPLAIYAISPDRSEMLLVNGTAVGPDLAGDLWEQPLPAGTPHRVGNIRASAAAWTPDAAHILYAHGHAILIAKSDGSEPHELAEVAGIPRALRFSLDARKVRFYLTHPDSEANSIWEMDSDGQNVHPLLPGWKESSYQCCGNWSPDANYYYFQAGRGVAQAIWVLPRSRSFIAGRASEPSRLTSGPLRLSSPVPSTDGKRLFVIGENPRVELMRYDLKAHRFDSYLQGLSAGPIDFSPDGKWIAYISYPDMTLWRSRLDGTGKMQLTFPPVRAYGPRWSPDSSKIAFMDVQFSQPWKIRLVSAAGGASDLLVHSGSMDSEDDPTWASDGQSLVFAASGGPDRAEVAIFRMDLKSGKVLAIPGSRGLFSPRLSPDGRYICALNETQTKLMLHAVNSNQWSSLAEGELLGYNEWSHDGKYVYLRDSLGGAGEIVRVSRNDRALQPVLSLKDFPQPADIFAGWIGLTPDDAPLLMRDRSVQEIYALELRFP